jgi:hypothetical protein
MATQGGYDPLGQDNRNMLAYGLSIVGGLFIGSWAVKHLFSEGITPEEKKSMLAAGAIGLVMAGGLALDIDKKYWDAEAGAEYLQNAITGAK